MKNNWVRLIAGVLVSVALVGAISLTGGMKRGSRTDGLLYEASGLHPDGQLLLVNGKPVTCEEYLYWLAYDCEYLSTYVQDIDWSAELTSGVTYGDYAQTDTLETVKLYSVVRAWAEEAGITLTDEDQEALDAQRGQCRPVPFDPAAAPVGTGRPCSTLRTTTISPAAWCSYPPVTAQRRRPTAI